MAIGQVFEDVILRLEDFGLTDVFLPFMLIFTIVFAILQKTRILGEDKRNINMMAALVLALLVVIPHVTNSYPPDADIVVIMNTALPQVSLLIVAIVLLILIIGIFGPEGRWIGGSPSGIAAIIGIVGILWIFGASAGWIGGWEWFIDTFGEENVTLVIVILVFAVVVFAVTRDKRTPGEGIMNRLEGLFRK